MGAIYLRELKSYFTSMIGYVFTAFVVGFAGIYFMAFNMFSGYPYFSYTLITVMLILIFTIPILTMRSFADEQKTKTDQLLLTAPVTIFGIVMGKFLAMATVFAIPVLICCLCPLIISFVGTAYLLVDYSTLFAFFLLGCVYISIGMFISSLTESPVIAAVGTLFALILLYLWPTLVAYIPTTAKGSMLGFIILASILCLIIYNVTKDWIVPAIIDIVVAIINIAIFFVKPELLENALPNLLNKFDLMPILSEFALYDNFSIIGIINLISASAVFIFLTMQVIQRRRWC